MVKARKKAMDADVVIVNHHLFLADMVVKESGFGELIPQAEVMIFDEAHQLPDIASQYFGQSLSSRQLLDLAKDITIAYRTELKDTQQLQKMRRSPCPERPGFSSANWGSPATGEICVNC
ncbi:ATP-dependent helicase [Salmonella enterica subsp. enterica]|uniref:ATP-dependent helicase n=1 Tax=Salmonella enterica I TaxID=59201 RepID=A0A3S4I3M3_SALET|nr:ATP-dependent helicase [Salmonella enterica subsp. enterica]